MTTLDILTLYKYNYWANHRILAAAANVSQEQFVSQTTHSFGSLRGTLVHLLDAERAWRMLCQHNTTEYFDNLQPENFPNLDAVQELWQDEERAMRDYLASLTDADLLG